MMTKARAWTLAVVLGLGGAMMLSLTACQRAQDVSEKKSVTIEANEHVTEVKTQSQLGPQTVATHLKLKNYSLRAPLGLSHATAAYVEIENLGSSDDKLLSVSCNCAQEASLHTMRMNGTMMEMSEAKDGFDIKSGQALSLKPGGDHIMVMGLNDGLKAGQPVELTLRFARSGEVRLMAPVEGLKP